MSKGEVIKKIREKTGMTQAEFSENIGCKQNTLSQYENGKADPSIKIGLAIITLAKKYKIKITLEDIFREESDG